jgi:hypothetical protein
MAHKEQRATAPASVLPGGRPDGRAQQRDLVRASLIACPLPGDTTRDRRR